MNQEFEIIKEGGEEIEVKPVHCLVCTDYILKTPEEAQAILANWESFVCPNLDCSSNRKPGHLGVLRQEKCGVCQKVFSKTKENPTGVKMCYCPVTVGPQIKFVQKGWEKPAPDPTMQRINDEIEESQTNRVLLDRVNKARLEPTPVEKEIITLLQTLVTQNELKATKKQLEEITNEIV